jgi:hypothetical protein
MSKVLIGRQTLALIGRQSIESFEEDSPEARQVGTWYDDCRKEALAAHNFSFARRTVALALHGEPASDSWEFRYAMPPNYIRLWKVFAEGAKKAQPYELALVGEEVTLLTNVPDAYCTYTFDLQVTDLFSPGFTKALRYLLAHYIAPNLCGEVGIKQAPSYLQAYQVFLAQAAVQDANGELDRDEEEPAVLRVR